MKKIAFPNLGLEFNIDPTAFTVFGIDIQWYGIILSVGICCAFLLFYRNAVKKEQINGDTVYNVTLLVVPISIIGARFAYVITKWDYYKTKSFFDIINLRAGGIAIYGAIIFGLVTVLIYNKIKKNSSLSMLDALAPAVMLGQTIGRWGNFVNAEAYGWTPNAESLPWSMWLEKVYIDGVLTDYHYVHPTFLYESLWNALGLIIIMAVLYRKKKFEGEIFCAYLGWYGFGRTFIESIRADSLYIVGSLKLSVFIGVVSFIAAVILAIVFYKRGKAEAEELAEYVPSFEAVKLKIAAEEDALCNSVFETENSEDETEDEELPEESDDDDEEILREQAMLEGEIQEYTDESEE